MRREDKHVVNRMSEDDLKQFILDYLSGQVFTMQNLPSGNDAPMTFMPIALGAFEGWTRKQLEQVGTIWEYMNKAGSRSINGQPSFMSMRIMHKSDWKRALETIKTAQAKQKDLDVWKGH